MGIGDQILRQLTNYRWKN